MTELGELKPPSEHQRAIVDCLLNKPDGVKVTILAQHVRMRHGVTTALWMAAEKSDWKSIYYAGWRKADFARLSLLKSFQSMASSKKIKFFSLKSRSKLELEENDVVLFDASHTTLATLLADLEKLVSYNHLTTCHVICTLQMAPLPHIERVYSPEGEDIVDVVVSRKTETEQTLTDAILKGQGTIQVHYVDERPKRWKDELAYVVFGE